jgi:hypothetical protein
MRLLWSILILCHVINLAGQNRCGVDHRYFHKHDQLDQRFEQWIKANRSKETPSTSRSNSEAVYQLPVVVHLIHQGEDIGQGLNLTDEQVQEQIEILNQDFRRKNPDTLLTPNEFRSVAADTRIEFVLAKRDPEGLATTGIVRKQGSLNGYRYSDVGSRSDEYVLKHESQWPVDQYLNIYVTDILNGFIGYAQFPFINLEGVENPNYDPFLDGVVVDYKYFGINPDTGGSFESFGRTLTHEMGHFLGLRHVWGDQSPCEQDDFCDDTPEQSSSFNTQCPDSSSISCGSSDMYSNYLNYTNDACMNIFTNCQKQRMRTVVENSPRVNMLTQSPALQDPIQVANDLGIRKVIAPSSALCDNEIFPAVEVRNYGTDVISNGEIQFLLNDEVQQIVAITSQLAPLQQQIINFEPITFTSSGNYNISFRVNSVNSNTDQNRANDTVSISPIRFVAGPLPYQNSFSSNEQLLHSNAEVSSLNWQLIEAPFQTSNNTAAGITFDPTNQIGKESTFVTPVFDLSSLNSAELNFSYSYSVDQVIPTNDRFSVYVSVDCGQTYLTQDPLFQASGNSLITSGSLPQGPADWESISLNITQFAGLPDVKFAFAGIHGSGGTLLVDSISLVSSGLKAYDVGISELNNLPIVSCFSSVIPTLTVRNYGFETIQSLTVDYQLGSINESTVETGLNLVPGAETELFFPISRLSEGEYQMNFTISNPNDSVDQENVNNSTSYTFHIDKSSELVPSRNDFESASNWIIVTPEDTSIWEIISLDNEDHVLMANAFDNSSLGIQHWFVSPILDLSALDSASMTFLYTYQGRLNRTDKLSIYASPNCGGNFTDLLYSASSEELGDSFSNEKYIPDSKETWNRGFVDLSPFAGSNQLRVAFVFENGNGNNLFIDDIEFYQSSNTSILRFEESVTVYPNPATSYINVTLNLSARQPAEILLIEMSGKVVRSKSLVNALNQAIVIETTGLRGSYILTWRTPADNGSQMIFINN